MVGRYFTDTAMSTSISLPQVVMGVIGLAMNFSDLYAYGVTGLKNKLGLSCAKLSTA